MENLNNYKKELKKNQENLDKLTKEVDMFKEKQEKELSAFEEQIGYNDVIKKTCELERLIEEYYKDYLIKVYNLLVETIKNKNLSFYKVADELEEFDVYFEMMPEDEDEIDSFELIVNEEDNEYSLFLPDDYCDIEVLTINSIDLEKTLENIKNYLDNLKKEN